MLPFYQYIKHLLHVPHEAKAAIEKSSNHRSDIQWLRGLAVVAVILFHAKESLFSNGYLGVDAFFVISGFVVAPLLMRVFDTVSYKKIVTNLLSFYHRRFWRLVPTLGFVLGTSIFLIFLFASPSEHWRIAQQGLYSLVILGNLGAIKFSGDYFSPTPNPFIHTWSLSVEEQFYLGIPLVFLLIITLTRNRNKFKLIVMVLLTLLSFCAFTFPAVFSVFYSRFGFPTEVDFAFYSGVARCWQFLIGICAFFISSRSKRLPTASWKGNLGFFALAFLLFSNLPVSVYTGSILASLFTLLTLYSGATSKRLSPVTEVLNWIGDRSYSLYLTHMPLLYLAKYSPAFDISSRTDRSIQSVVAVFATFVLGSLIHGTVEGKSRLLGRRASPNPRPKVRFLILTLLIPALLLTSVNYAVRNGYLGLMHDLKKPPYPGFLDPKCQRDSDSGPPCTYKSEAASASVLLIGDSHAGQYSEALISASMRENWNAIIWAKGGCSFVLGKDHSNSLSDSCMVRNSQILEWVDVNRPQAVIISQYIHNNSNQADLMRSILTLRSLVPRIGIFENNPIFPDEKDFMVAKPLVMKPYRAPKKFTIGEMQDRDLQASVKLSSWAENQGMEVFRTWPLFCDEDFCYRFDNDTWLYTDDDHLSVAGANRTIPLIQKFLSSK